MKASNQTKQWMRTIRSIIGRINDLSPWLEWFATMQTFVESGLLEIQPPLSEAYITEAALHVLANTDSQLHSISATIKDEGKASLVQCQMLWQCIRPVVDRLNVYTQFLERAEDAYKEYLKAYDKAIDTPATDNNATQAALNLQKPGTHHRTFALHIVEGTMPHNLLYTIVVQYKRRWWWPFSHRTNYNIISYR